MGPAVLIPAGLLTCVALWCILLAMLYVLGAAVVLATALAVALVRYGNAVDDEIDTDLAGDD